MGPTVGVSPGWRRCRLLSLRELRDCSSRGYLLPNSSLGSDRGVDMTVLRRFSLAALLLSLVLWVGIVHLPVWLPPVTPAIIAAQPEPGHGPHRVFGYATLTNPAIRLAVVGEITPAQEAHLAEFRRDGRDMRPDEDATLSGMVFAVDDAGLLRLDRYERLGTMYRRDRFTLTDGTQAWVYRLIHQD